MSAGRFGRSVVVVPGLLAAVLGVLLPAASPGVSAEEGGTGLRHAFRGAAKGKVEFWPLRVSPDRDHQIVVLLAVESDLPEAYLDCGGQVHDLGPAAWSHPAGHLHGFDLEWTVPRKRAACSLYVDVGGQRFLAATHGLAVRPEVRSAAVKGFSPAFLPEDREGAIEVFGSGFSEEVTVLWVAADRFAWYERSVRSSGTPDRGSVVVPFSPAMRGVDPGQYMLVVLNEDRSGGASGGWFVVEARSQAEVTGLAVVRSGSRARLVVEGVGLERVTECVLDLPAGRLPLAVRPEEGSAVPAIGVVLPPHVGEEVVRGADVRVEGSLLTITRAIAGRVAGEEIEEEAR